MLSNMARAALLWRHGGIYLDLVGAFLEIQYFFATPLDE